MEGFFSRDHYKKGFETFLIMNLNQYQFVLGSDLEYYAQNSDTFGIDNPCNIYFILARPKVTVAPESVVIDGKIVKLQFVIHEPENEQIVKLGFEFREAKSDLKFESKYPYNFFKIYDGKDVIFAGRPGTIIDSSEAFDNIPIESLDYEVLYIGQAYGENGERMALDRLKSHETVQRIFADASANNPDFDIWVMLANFADQSMVLHMPGEIQDRKVLRKNGDHRVPYESGQRALNINEKQKLNFTEAALINYFKPTYNINFKGQFPTPKHRSYSDCYTLDVKALFVELDTSDNTRRIYTDYAERTEHHVKMFEFNSDEDRISLLDFADSLSNDKAQ